VRFYLGLSTLEYIDGFAWFSILLEEAIGGQLPGVRGAYGIRDFALRNMGVEDLAW